MRLHHPKPIHQCHKQVHIKDVPSARPQCWPQFSWPISAIMNTSEHVQMAKNKRDIKQGIVTFLQVHVINVAQLCDLIELAVRWYTTSIYFICQKEREDILAKMFLMTRWEHQFVGVGSCLTIV
jgi:hypothetical protein